MKFPTVEQRSRKGGPVIIFASFQQQHFAISFGAADAYNLALKLVPCRPEVFSAPPQILTY